MTRTYFFRMAVRKRYGTKREEKDVLHIRTPKKPWCIPDVEYLRRRSETLHSLPQQGIAYPRYMRPFSSLSLFLCSFHRSPCATLPYDRAWRDCAWATENSWQYCHSKGQ